LENGTRGRVKVSFGNHGILHSGPVQLSPKYSSHVKDCKVKNIIMNRWLKAAI